jgi:hypothetical protein
MSDESPTTIHYIDSSEYYNVYGTSTLIIVLLLLWYFIRTNLEEPDVDCDKPHHRKAREGLNGINIEDPDILALMPEFQQDFDAIPLQLTAPDEPKPYKFWSGTYGDVPLNLYDVKDIAYKPEWDHRTAMYIPNMRTIFRNTYS